MIAKITQFDLIFDYIHGGKTMIQDHSTYLALNFAIVTSFPTMRAVENLLMTFCIPALSYMGTRVLDLQQKYWENI